MSELMDDAAKNSEIITWPRVILLGDSITQYSFSSDGRWGSILADKLQRKCDVINRGFSGYVTSWCKLIIPRIIPVADVQNIAAVTLLLGANDSNLKEANPHQHVPLADYKQNLIDMINELMKVGVSREKIILITPPACSDEKWTEELKSRGTNAVSGKRNSVTRVYAEACTEAGQEAGVQVIDFYTAMMETPNWQSLLIDGLHLSQEGSELLASLLWPAIDQRTKHLPMILPTYDMVDHENPSASLLL